MTVTLQKHRRIFFQVSLLIVLYAISRCAIILINLPFFQSISLGHFLHLALCALRYDIAAIAMINALYVFLFFLPPGTYASTWQRFIQLIFILFNCIALAFDVSDWAYLRFNQKRATADVLHMITRRGDFLNHLPGFIVTYWYVPVAMVFLCILLIVVNRKIVTATAFPVKQGFVFNKAAWIGFAIMITLTVIAIRGGFNRIPITTRDAVKVARGNEIALVLNTPFSIITTFTEKQLPFPYYMREDEAERYIQPVKQYHRTVNSRKNVVIIILESFSKEYTGLANGISYTPFLDSLMRRSYTCTNAYANALRSADGIPAITAGIPAIMDEPFGSSYYSNNKITSLPLLLRPEGYNAAFFHGGTNGTMSFDAFTANAGYEKYIGRSEYNNDEDYDGAWGIWDEPFLGYCCNYMGHMQQPFITTIFTLSSHEPYAIPPQYRHALAFAASPMERSIRYADIALKHFFESAASAPWFKNTLFVITADHTCPIRRDTSYYNKCMGVYAIPIIFYAPGDSTLNGTYTGITQQLDILPSVLDYIGYQKPFFGLGNSIFSRTGHRYIAEHQATENQFLNSGYLLKTYDDVPYGLYLFPADSTEKTDLSNEQGSSKSDQLQHLRAYLQVTYQALINNKMWADTVATHL